MPADLSHNLNDELPDGRPVKRFYALQEMFLGYFHPDWMLDDTSAEVVVRRFARDSPRAIQAVVAEIDELTAVDVSDEALRAHVLERYDLYYDPEHEGLTMRSWLTRVKTVLLSPSDP